MKISIYSLLFIFLTFGSALSEVKEIDCITNFEAVQPVLNLRKVANLIEPVSSSIDAEGITDLIYEYYEEENPEKQAALLLEIQSVFITGALNPNSEDFDGGSILFNIGMNDRDINKDKAYNVVSAILNYSGEEPVKLNIFDPIWNSAPLHQASVSLNGKVAAALLNYKKGTSHAANPYLLNKRHPLTFLGRLPLPVDKESSQDYSNFFGEIYKADQKLLNLPLSSKGSITFLSHVKAASEVEIDIYKSSTIKNGLLSQLDDLGMRDNADSISKDKWE